MDALAIISFLFFTGLVAVFTVLLTRGKKTNDEAGFREVERVAGGRLPPPPPEGFLFTTRFVPPVFPSLLPPRPNRSVWLLLTPSAAVEPYENSWFIPFCEIELESF